MKATAHATAAVTRVLVSLAWTRGNALNCVVVGMKLILMVLLVLLLLLQAVDIVKHQHGVILQERMSGWVGNCPKTRYRS